ncbi:MAG: hypothetical protein QG673_655 [Pseudomonadota bacterium]|nr:hypothetical protein [Pseudomonadota bacterium]
MQDCVLCNEDGGKIIYTNHLFRIVLPSEPDYPGFTRIIANPHVKELTDLSQSDAEEIFSALYNVELAIRKIYLPDKINIASLGNVVPHLHWHIIPRYINDKHYPNPIWGAVVNPEYAPDRKLYALEQSLVSQIISICTLLCDVQ